MSTNKQWILMRLSQVLTLEELALYAFNVENNNGDILRYYFPREDISDRWSILFNKCGIGQLIKYSFSWQATAQGYSYWSHVDEKWNSSLKVLA